MAQPQPRRTAPRAVSVISVDSSPPTQTEFHSAGLPPHYLLPPTIPSPFIGTLEASLDAILSFNSRHPQLFLLCDALRKDVDSSTNWPLLIQKTLSHGTHGRALLEDFLFLVTRTLLPEQIAENRGLMERMYFSKKNLSTRVMLRYDMLREWQKRDHSHFVVADSKPPSIPSMNSSAPAHHPSYLDRRPLLPNVISTLIAAPPGGYGTRKLSDAMRHHVTELDRFLLFTDEEVASWSGAKLLTVLAATVLQWQWLRKNTEDLADFEINQWEDVDLKADENEWVRDARNSETKTVKEKQ